MPRNPSPAQRAASAANGRASTGPATPAGRARIAASALRHGFFSSAVVLPSEDPAAFDAFLNSLIERFQPADELELRLVRKIAAADWRLERLYDVESATYSHTMDRQAPDLDRTYSSLDQETRLAFAFSDLTNNSRTLDRLHRFESRFFIEIERAVRLLARTQKMRRERTMEQSQVTTSPENLLNLNDDEKHEPEPEVPLTGTPTAA